MIVYLSICLATLSFVLVISHFVRTFFCLLFLESYMFTNIEVYLPIFKSWKTYIALVRFYGFALLFCRLIIFPLVGICNIKGSYSLNNYVFIQSFIWPCAMIYTGLVNYFLCFSKGEYFDSKTTVCCKVCPDYFSKTKQEISLKLHSVIKGVENNCWRKQLGPKFGTC